MNFYQRQNAYDNQDMQFKTPVFKTTPVQGAFTGTQLAPAPNIAQQGGGGSPIGGLLGLMGGGVGNIGSGLIGSFFGGK